MLLKSPRNPQRYSKQNGFTLIELLMVISVILILSGITFGISRGVQNAQARTEAKAELAVIAQALEQFKSTYGDYPWVGNTKTSNENANLLLKSLIGWTILESDTASDPPSMRDVAVNEGPKKSFVDPLKLTLSGTIPPTGEPAETVYLLDPWGNKYVYAYKIGGWEKFGYLLFSEGPDGNSSSIPQNGILTQFWRSYSANTDNIHAGE